MTVEHVDFSQVPWTMLREDAVAQKVWEDQQFDGVRYYHNTQHLLAIYECLRDLEIRYSEALDWAILFHDYVMDSRGDCESRSADAMRGILPNHVGVHMTGEAEVILMATQRHSALTCYNRNAMVCADLSAFLSTSDTLKNRELLFKEYNAMRPDANLGVDAWSLGTKEFLGNLRDNLYETLNAKNGRVLLNDVIDDIVVGMDASQSYLDEHLITPLSEGTIAHYRMAHGHDSISDTGVIKSRIPTPIVEPITEEWYPFSCDEYAYWWSVSTCEVNYVDAETPYSSIDSSGDGGFGDDMAKRIATLPHLEYSHRVSNAVYDTLSMAEDVTDVGVLQDIIKKSRIALGLNILMVSEKRVDNENEKYIE